MQQQLLLIDDSEAIHSLLRARLKDEPIQIHSAGSGEQGLQLAAALIPDLILLDVEMPDPNGFEVCRRLKTDEKLTGIPVIFLTGAASSEQKIRGLELGAVDYITKPFDPAELRARVRGALRMKFMIDLLAQKAQIDALTGLWNRRHFDQRFDAELSLARRAKRSLAVCMLDIDHFKSINDRFGHPVGDEVLKRVSTLLADTIRTEDTVCRYGGEEFAVIAPNTGDGAAVLGERIRAAVQAMDITIGSKHVPVTVSIGVALCGRDYSRSTIERADQALYRSKQNGRNRVEIADPQQEQSAAA